MQKKKIIYFTKYTSKGPSSRYRSYQYHDFFKTDFDILYLPLFDDNLSNSGGVSFSLNIVYLYLKRVVQIFFNLFSADIFVVEYELFPYTPPIFEYLFYLLKRPFFLDFDDAIFHNYDHHKSWLVRKLLKNKISFISKLANGVITGSTYLSAYFRQFNNNIFQIPTSIIFSKYNINIESKPNSDELIIGWIGSKSTSRNLIDLLPVFQKCSLDFTNVKFIFCGFDNNLVHLFKGVKNLSFIEWSIKNELVFLNSIDVGIMPLDDNLFNKGKCGFKLIQYMAFGKITISTPLLSNVEINHGNKNLFASSSLEWIERISFLLQNGEFVKEVGKENINIVKRFYSCETNYLKYLKIFKSIE